MSAKLKLLLAVIFGLLLLGLASLNGNVIALAMPLLLYLALALVRRPENLQLRATRALSKDHASPGTPVEVKLHIVNDGASIDELIIEDMLPDRIEVIAGEPRIAMPLLSNAEIELAYTVRAERGEFSFDSALISASDSSGLFHKASVLSAPARLLIRPQTQRLRPLNVRPPRTRGFTGPIPSRQSGSGVDFFGLREYQMGDRLRWMNWRVSARHVQDLFTNEFEQERIADVGLILDARQQNDVQTPTGSLFDHAIQATASLAETLLDTGNRVGLLIYGRGREGVFPGYGRMQRERIFRALGRTATGHNYALESLNRLPTRFFPARSQIIFIGPLSGSDDVAVLTRLRANGYSVMVVSPDAVDFELRALGSQMNQPSVQYANRLSHIERRLALLSLRRVGVRVVDWRVDQPLDPVLAASTMRAGQVRGSIPGNVSR